MMWDSSFFINMHCDLYQRMFEHSQIKKTHLPMPQFTHAPKLEHVTLLLIELCLNVQNDSLCYFSHHLAVLYILCIVVLQNDFALYVRSSRF